MGKAKQTLSTIAVSVAIVLVRSWVLAGGYWGMR